MGDEKGAKRVEECRAASGVSWSCKRRDCPSCAPRAAAAAARRVRGGFGNLIERDAFLITFLSLRLRDLGDSWDAFRESLGAFWRQLHALGARGAVGGIEPRLSSDGDRWTLHAHLAIDGIAPEWEDGLAKEWRRMTNGRGRFERDSGEHVRDDEGFAAYVTKPNDWSPSPGAISLEAWDILRRATRGRQLVLMWGTARAR